MNAAEPGFVRSDFNRHARGLRAAAIGLSARFFAVTPAKGADTLVWSSVAPELRAVTGKRFAERKEKEGKFREPDLIADLERRCELFAADGARRRHAKAPTHPADHKAGGGTP